MRLWLIDLDSESERAPGLAGVLSSREVARGARFRNPLHGSRYLRARGHLRRLLAAETGKEPAELVLRAGTEGKPFLSDGPSFNVSHSGRWLLVGICAAGRLGVDIEVDDPVPEGAAIARTYFTEGERAALDREGPEAFLRLWTRKEAMVKALGGGLSVPLDAFSVSAGATSGQALLELGLDGERLEDWSVVSVPLREGLHAAIAMDRPLCQLRIDLADDACGPARASGSPTDAPPADLPKHHSLDVTLPQRSLPTDARRTAPRATSDMRFPR
ncbi:MAG: 4'-phosphopantetheinyl transferase superfamily protein [Pseudomonadales bacterium]|nr:4'-phosphopantetheinyl transferase superfamily protein [Pseudomonadales bacterium]